MSVRNPLLPYHRVGERRRRRLHWIRGGKKHVGRICGLFWGCSTLTRKHTDVRLFCLLQTMYQEFRDCCDVVYVQYSL